MHHLEKKVYIVMVILSLVMTIYSSYLTINYPYIGANAGFNSNGDVIIKELDPNAWADKVGLEVGDIVVTANGKPASTHETIKLGTLEQINTIQIIKNDSKEKLNLVVKNSLLNQQSVFMFLMPVSFYIMGLICIYYIYHTNKRLNLPSAFVLNLFILAVAISYVSAMGSGRGDILLRYVNVTFFLLVPVLYIHFIYQYFIELGKKLYSFKYILFSYSIWMLNLLLECFKSFIVLPPTVFKSVNLISFFVLILLSFFLKFKGFIKVKYSEQKYLVKVLIITNIMAFAPFIFLYIVPFVIFKKYIFSPAILASFLLLIPFSLVYQFVATKIYDIEFILGRIRYYALLAILPSIVFIVVMILVKDNSTTFYTIKLFIFVYLLMLLVFYLKEIVDFRFKLRRFSEKYNYQDSIFKFINEIGRANNLKQVVNELEKTIIDVLIVTKAHFIEVDGSGQIVSIDHLRENDDSNLRETDLHLDILKYQSEIKETLDEVGKIKELNKGFFINVGSSKGHNYILLCLSSINTPRLTRDEISWLKALSFYTNVSLENYLKIEELMNHLETVQREGTNPSWLTKLFFSIEEKQRSNLAKDLHDSVLQDLISLKRQCEVALVELEAAPADLKDQLEDMNENMTKIIKTTRETCQELRPQLLYDLGLVKALNKLVTQYKEIADFEIRMNAGKFQPNTDLDVQLNLYRIIQELLNNANKHSHASNVLIMLVCIKDKIVLHYEDDGIGFNQSEISYSSENMGLSGITERVKALKGTLTIETSKGQGFKAVIEI
ncbi:sensor histidine kinase [Bacillus sp. SJS]|uniref:sensor histidine kinase n=1 Tax=Bacillus sp. SJS TaxID=1423321 RepID=UPI0004DD77D2|nr:sensor histidine kinase [Bacillus sp. SJS]KZZ83389.1 hypothetical protein AS29_016700 [Bacillus sp. SJS]